MNNAKKINKQQKEYMVIYQSEEHYEVLGFVQATSLREAIEKAQIDLLSEAKYYNVNEAEIAEIAKFDTIIFNII